MNGSWLRLGALGWSAVALPGCGCAEASCNDDLTVRGALGVPSSERLVVDVEACRDDACSSGVLDGDPEIGGAQARLAGGAAARASLSFSGAESWELFVSFEPDDAAGGFEDGDRVVITVVDRTSGQLLVRSEQTVDYRRDAPNGEWCGPICTVADVEL